MSSTPLREFGGNSVVSAFPALEVNGVTRAEIVTWGAIMPVGVIRGSVVASPRPACLGDVVTKRTQFVLRAAGVSEPVSRSLAPNLEGVPESFFLDGRRRTGKTSGRSLPNEPNSSSARYRDARGFVIRPNCQRAEARGISNPRVAMLLRGLLSANGPVTSESRPFKTPRRAGSRPYRLPPSALLSANGPVTSESSASRRHRHGETHLPFWTPPLRPFPPANGPHTSERSGPKGASEGSASIPTQPPSLTIERSWERVQTGWNFFRVLSVASYPACRTTKIRPHTPPVSPRRGGFGFVVNFPLSDPNPPCKEPAPCAGRKP
jgi:hypothetical protein